MQNDSKSRGEMYMELMFNAEEIGVLLPEPHPDRALRIFLDVASSATHSAIAPRVSQMPNAILLLSAVQGDPASGAIYVYRRDSGQFYLVLFTGGREDDLTVGEYEALVAEYELLEYAAQPARIRTVLRAAGSCTGTA